MTTRGRVASTGRSASVRPAPRSAAARKADALVRTLGKPEPELLEALLDGVNVAELIEKTQGFPVADLLETAFAVHVQVYEFLQTCAREQRALLRTCSHQLIALAMDQACLLEAIQRRESDRSRDRQDARRQVEQLLGEGLVLYEQALELLKKVGGNDALDGTEFTALPATPGATPAASALLKLAKKAKALLEHPSPKVQLRNVLYGLDRPYVESLAKVAIELDRSSKAGLTCPPVASHQKELEQTRAVTWLMVNHFVSAFDAARRVDKSIPVIDVRKLEPGAAKPAAAVTKPANGGGSLLGGTGRARI